MTVPLRGLYVMDDDVFDDVYGPEERHAIERYVTVAYDQMNSAALRACPEYLADIDVLITSWGCPELDSRLLAHAPRLRVVFYAAGSVRKVVTPEVWERNITVVSASQSIADELCASPLSRSCS